MPPVRRLLHHAFMPCTIYWRPPGQEPVLLPRDFVPDKLKDPDGLLWLDWLEPAVEDLDWLGKTFGFHPLALEDCVHQGQRPKVDDYRDYLFVVLHEMERIGGCYELEELALFLGPNYVVTVHVAPIRAVDKHLRYLLEGQSRALKQTAGHLFYGLADSLVDDYFPILDELDDRLDVLEDAVLENPDPTAMQQLFDFKKDLGVLRKETGPMRDVFLLLTSRSYERLPDGVSFYLRDVYDHLVRIYERVDALRDLVSGAMDVYLSQVSNRMNAIMKQLALISTVFLPLTFITGIFGMNFGWSPQVQLDQGGWFWAVNASLLIIALAMILWFRHKEWL